MWYPRLLHPVPVQIEPLKRKQSLVDEDYREPVQDAARPKLYVIPGQVKWGLDQKLRPMQAGPELESDGYIIFRRLDLKRVGIEDIQQNDRFVKIGQGVYAINVDLYVISVRLEGHYPSRGGATLVKAFFRDRMPSRQNKGEKTSSGFL